MASVMLVSTATNIGGMERVVCSLARGLDASGWEVRTFFPAEGSTPELLEWCADQGVDAEVHPAVLDAAAPHSPRTARAFRRLVRDVDPDVVNLHYGDNFLSLYDVVGARTAGLRRAIVASIHHPSEWSAGSRRKQLMTAVGARAVDRVSTFSGATRRVLLDAGLRPDQIEVIPCGVPVPTAFVERAAARRVLDLDDDAFVVGTLARLVEYKGIDRLITATDCPELTGTVLLIGGDGPHRPTLEAFAEDSTYGRTRFLGRVADPGDVFAASDVFALPSRLEGFGLVYVEAAMYGIPSIAARVGGVPDAVVHDETGILIDPDDATALRAAIVAMFTDRERRETLGRSARQRALHELDEGTMVARFDSLYRDVMAT